MRLDEVLEYEELQLPMSKAVLSQRILSGPKNMLLSAYTRRLSPQPNLGLRPTEVHMPERPPLQRVRHLE